MKKLAMMTFIALFALTGVAAARGPAAGFRSGDQKGPEVGFWEREQVSDALSLTEEEIGKLNELGTAHRETIRDLREQMRAERENLRDIMVSEEYSASAAKDHFDKAEALRAEMEQEKFAFQLEVRELLGQERYMKLKDMKQRGMERQQSKWSHHKGGMKN